MTIISLLCALFRSKASLVGHGLSVESNVRLTVHRYVIADRVYMNRGDCTDFARRKTFLSSAPPKHAQGAPSTPWKDIAIVSTQLERQCFRIRLR